MSAGPELRRQDSKKVTDAAKDLFEGARIFHSIRGPGCVANIDHNDPRGKPFGVAYDNGEFHRCCFRVYLLLGLMKFFSCPCSQPFESNMGTPLQKIACMAWIHTVRVPSAAALEPGLLYRAYRPLPSIQ